MDCRVHHFFHLYFLFLQYWFKILQIFHGFGEQMELKKNDEKLHTQMCNNYYYKVFLLNFKRFVFANMMHVVGPNWLYNNSWRAPIPLVWCQNSRLCRERELNCNHFIMYNFILIEKKKWRHKLVAFIIRRNEGYCDRS